MSDVLIGKITHYFDKIGVAVVEITDNALKVGDKIKIKGHNQEFEQEVVSMQVEHKNIKQAAKGDIVGLKVNQPAKEGDEIFKVEE